MIIECRLKRPGGSDIDIDGVVYEFRPNQKEQHVCEVENEVHAQRFLSIVEAYKIPGAPDSKPLVTSVVESSEGPSTALDDDAVKTFLVEELGIENPEDEEELIAYGDEVLGIDVANATSDGTVMDIARRIVDHQPEPGADDDEQTEMSDVELLAYVVDVFGIGDPTDKDALQAYAIENLGIKVPKTMSAINMSRAMVEADQASAAE